MSGIIAVDIGGTQIRVAIYPKNSNKAIKILKAATVDEKSDVFDRLVALIGSVWPSESVDAISVATAGSLDPNSGIVIEASNIPGWTEFPLRQKLSQEFHVPTFIGNDANLAAVGEWQYGAGQGHHHLLYMTISTGIGGGVICGDRLLEGSRGMAAELGHVVVLPGGPLCSCGVRGHLEAIASGPAIARYISEQMSNGRSSQLPADKTLSARTASDAARNGDALAIEAFNRAGKYLGQALAGFLHIFNPSIVIFGGGVSQAGELLFTPMRESMCENLMTPAYMKELQLAPAQLGDDVGLLGALAHARNLLRI